MISSFMTQTVLVPLFFVLLMVMVAKTLFRSLFSWKGIMVLGVLFYLGLLTTPNINQAVGYISKIFYGAAKTAMSQVP